MRSQRLVLVAVLLAAALVSCQKDGAPATTVGPTNEGATLGVEITASSTSGTAPFVVTFNAEPKGGKAPYTFSWTFGDGTGSSEQNPVKTFTTGGLFRTALTVTSGEERVQSSALDVSVDAGVRLGCSIGPNDGVVGHEVSVRGNATGGNGSFAYRWAFGDGAVASTAEARHTYTSPGTYTVTGTAQSGGASATCRDTIRVFDRLINNCRAFDATGPAPMRVAFWAQANYCSDSGCQFAWDFGDGTSAAGKGLMRPEHDYNAPGTYDVVVRVRTDDASDACSVQVVAQ